MEIRAVVFDMDGTIVDSPLDFDAIREDIGLPRGADILVSIAAMEEPERSRALTILNEHERLAAREAIPRPGALEVLGALRERGIRTALLTRNSAASVSEITRRLGLELDAVVSREQVDPKPSPEGIYRIAGELGVDPERMLMVGDYVFDMQTGKAAGAKTAFVKGAYPPPPEADYILEELGDLIPLIERETARQSPLPGQEP